MGQNEDVFPQLFEQARSEQDALPATLSERQQLEADGVLDRIGAYHPQGDVPAVSERAIALIVMFEVSSRDVYERRYRRPVWPHGSSGVTIGIGYDVGHVGPAALALDWQDQLPQAQIDLLAPACGVKGSAAQALLAGIHGVDIPYENAMAVFRGVTLRQTAAVTATALPNAARLHPDSFGALVSLVYNRGASFRLAGERYADMRQIREDMAASRFAAVPCRIRAMKRLWDRPELRGLVRRRELEAVLFEEGLAA